VAIRDGCWNASGVLPPDPLALDVAIELAYRYRPSLQIAAQQINRARGGQAIAFSPFLPSVKGTVRQIGAIEPIQGYTTQTLPTVVGFGPGAQDFSLAELHVQWILWDFGKTLGNYDAAVGQREIAELQLARARQTTAYDVTVTYFQVLFAQASRRVAEEALRRAESHLFVATNMLREGATDPDDVLRAEVQLAETRQQLVAAQTNELILTASLNRVIGVNVNYPTKVIPIEEEPSVPYSLVDCLQSAVDNREEFRVIQRAIANAQSEARSVRGEFLPRISVAGTAANVEGSGINAGGVAIAGINFDMDLFAGGRKLGELRQANADIRIAVARAKEVCDTIAFEVNQAYRLIDDARQRITLAQTAVRHATENARLVDNKFAQGDATPTDVVDAETTLTRAQQSLAQARYDYQTSLAQLTYATGAELPYDTTTTVIENHAAVPEREVPKNDTPQLTPIQPKEGGSP
jgi:outer membrane protein TolC